MALVDICGFDKTTTLSHIFGVTAPQGVINASNGRFASGNWEVNGGDYFASYNVRTIRTIGNYAELYIGFAARRGNSGTSGGGSGFFHLWDGGSCQLFFCFGASGLIEVRRGAYNGTVIVTSGANLWPADFSWRWVDLHVIIHNTTGQIEMKVTGASWIASAANLNTRSTANNFATGWGTGGGNGWSGTGGLSGVDDVHIADTTGAVNNTWLGDRRVVTLRPDASGDSAQGTSSGGGASVFGNVDDTGTPNGDTDYNLITTVGNKDLFNLGALPMTIGTVWGTMLSIYARKTDAGTCDMNPLEKSGATETTGTAQSLLSSFSFIQDVIRQVNPATGVAYTIAEINALQAGYKRAA